MDTFALLFCIIIILLASLSFFLVARKNYRSYKFSDDYIHMGYFPYSNNKPKLHLILISIFSMILSIVYLLALPFYVYYIAVPVIKDIPNLVNNNYSYTVGTINRIQYEKDSNIIFINDLKLYEIKIFLNGKLQQEKIYKIAYLSNTHNCVGFEELK